MRIKDCAVDVENQVSAAWPGKKLNKQKLFIQISTPIDNEYIHYEVLEEHRAVRVVLHIEDYDDKSNSYPYEKLLQFLKVESAENPNIEWVKWNLPDRECRLKRELNTSSEICDGLNMIIEIFDPLISKFEANQKLYNEEQEYQRLDDLNESEDVCLLSINIKELFDCNLTIPDYQRIYCWDNKRITGLWNNLLEMPDSRYHLGAIILHHNGDKFDIIDGQQRLVTLTIIINELYKKIYKTEECEVSLPLLTAQFESADACENVANSKYIIENLTKHCNDNELSDLMAKIYQNLEFSVLILKNTSLDLAYTFFSNQNSRGVALSDYDILKAHHLRYLAISEQAEHLAQKWDILSQEKESEKTTHLERTLGLHLFRLRKWMRKKSCDEVIDRPVKEEFSAAPTMTAIPPFGERFYFYEKIQGGSHFFAYTETFVECYRRFVKLPHVRLLREHLMRESHWKYESVIESLLFGYYAKYGSQYLSEALFCITGVIARHRYENTRAMQYKINQHAQDSELIMMIDQASSPTFFIAETLPYITSSGREMGYIAGRFYKHLKDIFMALLDVEWKKSEFTYEDRRLMLVTDNYVRKMIEKEYGK